MSNSVLSQEVQTAIFELFQAHQSRWSFLRPVQTTRAVSQPIDVALEQHDPRDVATVAAQIRETIGNAQYAAGHTHHTTGNAHRMMASLASANSGAALALTTHSSGFVRETAVRSIRQIRGPFALALLLVRLNDWVAQVRAVTAAQVMQLANEEDGIATEAIIACIDLIIDDRRFMRAGQEATLALARLTGRPEVSDRIIDVVLSSKTDDSPRYLKLLLRLEDYDKWLPEIMLRAAHVRSRELAFGALLRGKVSLVGANGMVTRQVTSTEDATDLAISGLANPSVYIRRASLDHIITARLSWDGDHATLFALVGDRAESVSERACYALKARSVDFVSPLKKALSNDPDDAIAVRALGKFGKAEHANLIYRASQKCQHKNRILYLKAAASLGSVDAASDLKTVIAKSQTVSEARRAAKALRRAGHTLSYSELLALADQGIDLFASGLFSFVHELPPVQLAHLIALTRPNPADPRMNASWRRLIVKRNRGAFMPRDEDVQNLADALKGQALLSRKIGKILGLESELSNRR